MKIVGCQHLTQSSAIDILCELSALGELRQYRHPNIVKLLGVRPRSRVATPPTFLVFSAHFLPLSFFPFSSLSSLFSLAHRHSPALLFRARLLR